MAGRCGENRLPEVCRHASDAFIAVSGVALDQDRSLARSFHGVTFLAIVMIYMHGHNAPFEWMPRSLEPWDDRDPAPPSTDASRSIRLQPAATRAFDAVTETPVTATNRTIHRITPSNSCAGA
ncbi:MAG TPA: hypothetical protein VL048_10755 [Xanthobacteraceae bacterium]|nr:hypothetical protein [Xanthobacteraceae bacterium]